ncbi:LytTR family transcriptional regulator DNA-binding domain-containing protein, partial [Aquiflexum sp.]|uniref:LytTR family transcriptional regulator DNA-binding domain-containing protein n=1 Tax=Aquiflexum sp. TaxID=1872584 RepID=UPI0035944228
KIFKADGSNLLVSKSLGWIEKKLPLNQFIRIHHSFVVNIKKIDRYDKKNNYLFLKNGKHLSVSIRKSPDLFRHFA